MKHVSFRNNIKESLTQTPQSRLAWCKCQMSRGPHLLAAQLKRKKKFCIS